FEQNNTEKLQKDILSIPGIKAAVPFKELQALARGRSTTQQAVLVRGLNADTPEIDKSMSDKLDFEKGFFDITDNNFILLGSELAKRLSLNTGDEVILYSISGVTSSEDEGSIGNFTVTGIFRTGYYEYDCSWAFINIEGVSILDNESELKLGVKIENRFQDRHLLEQARKKTMSYEGLKITSWRDYNRSFFGALRTEKLFMFILVGLIFIVVGLNIFQAQRRSVLQRREDIGLLRAVGGSRKNVRFVFVLDGAIIGLTGAGIGLFLGLAIASNIPQFFSFIEKIVNWFIGIINIIANFFGTGTTKSFRVFSPAIFYIKEIPSRVLIHEVILIFMFGFLSALLAAWFASRKITKIQPAEVLRYE
ncbi:MAG: FtsX-like permease family protein, partial [Treponema sp.]|nr:FtsX-like permease family protein [Treponema sp.]